VKIEIL